MIIVNTGINDGSLPRSASFVEQLKATPSLLSWHRCSVDNVNPGDATAGRPVVDVFNLKGAGSFSNYVNDATRPKYGGAQVNGRPGILFDGVGTLMQQFNEMWNLRFPWTMALVYRADPSGGSATQAPLAAFDSTSVVTGFLQDGDRLSMRHGTGEINIAMPRGNAVFAMLSSDSAFLRARVNGAEYGPAQHNNVQPVNAPRFGAFTNNGVTSFFKGALMDVLFFTDDLLGHDRATAALVERYVNAQRSYNFGFSPLRAR